MGEVNVDVNTKIALTKCAIQKLFLTNRSITFMEYINIWMQELNFKKTIS